VIKVGQLSAKIYNSFYFMNLLWRKQRSGSACAHHQVLTDKLNAPRCVLARRSEPSRISGRVKAVVRRKYIFIQDQH
jgi:uncharacterized membrane protein